MVLVCIIPHSFPRGRIFHSISHLFLFRLYFVGNTLGYLNQARYLADLLSNDADLQRVCVSHNIDGLFGG